MIKYRTQVQLCAQCDVMVHAAPDLSAHVRHAIIRDHTTLSGVHAGAEPPPEAYALVRRLLSTVSALQNKEQQQSTLAANDNEPDRLHRMIAEAKARRDSLQTKHESLTQLLAQSENIVGPDESGERRAEIELSAKAHAAAMAEVLNRLNSRVVEALAD